MSTLLEGDSVGWLTAPPTGATSGDLRMPVTPLGYFVRQEPLPPDVRRSRWSGKWRPRMNRVSVGGADEVVVIGGFVEPAADPANAFAVLDELRSDDDLFREGVAALRGDDSIVCRDAICDRLVSLLELYREDYDGRALSADSLASFVAFLSAKPRVRLPSLTASPSGHIYATWKDRNQGGEKVGVFFLPGGRARYTAFVRNGLHGQRLDEHSGATTADVVGATLVALDLGRWLEE